MIALSWDGGTLTGDLVLADDGLGRDDSLTTAVLISLFSDRRARPDDVLPDGAGGDRRGWIGDALAAVEGDRIGSRLWLLGREKQTEETRRRAIEYCREALAWLITDRLATAIAVDAAWVGPGLLGMRITITEPGGGSQSMSVNVKAGGA